MSDWAALALCLIFALPSILRAAPPVINSFTTDQLIITAGSSANLKWDLTNFDSLSLNGSALPNGDTTIAVSPLVTTVYTLSATNIDGSVNAEVTVAVQDAPDFIGANGRFIEVVKNSTTNTYLHISEIEAFAPGTAPDEADGDGTSQNDLVQAGSPSTEFPQTTTSLHHGLATSVYDGNLESGAEVWTTINTLETKKGRRSTPAFLNNYMK